MQISPNNQIWYEKYRPQNINDLILPENIKSKLREFLQKPYHLLLSSPTPGTGKTSTVNALIKEGGFESLFINASLDNGVDTLRSQVVQFASSESVNGLDRIVILDEIDNQSQFAMAALKGIIEEFSNNAKFIATCNYASKILPAIVNRFCVFDYEKIYQDTQTMIPGIFNRLKFILENENITYNPEDLKNLIKQTYPSFRLAVGSLQQSVTNGKLELQVDTFAEFDSILKAIKENNYPELVKTIYALGSIEGFYTWMFERVNKATNLKPNLFVVLAKYQYQDAFARDKKLNLIACCTEIISGNLI